MKFVRILASVSIIVILALQPVGYSGITQKQPYSEKLDIYVAGSSALWSITLTGVNASNAHLSQIENISGLSSFSLTALKINQWQPDFQVFTRDAYGVINVPFVSDQGLFLSLTVDSPSAAQEAVKGFDSYLGAFFTPVSNSSNRYVYFSPANFESLIPSTLLGFLPSSRVGGFANLASTASVLTFPAPIVTLSGQKNGTLFVHSLRVGTPKSAVLSQSGALLLGNVIGSLANSMQASKFSQSSMIVVHALDGVLASNVTTNVKNNLTSFTGIYSLSVSAGNKTRGFNVAVLQTPPVIQATRKVYLGNTGFAKSGNNVSVTLDVRNSGPLTASNLTIRDDWWKNYPGLFALKKGSSDFVIRSLKQGAENTTTYVLRVTGANASELLVPPSGATFTFSSLGTKFSGTAVFNSFELPANQAGSALSFFVRTDLPSPQAFGARVRFVVNVTNTGSLPALNLAIGGNKSNTLSPGGAPWLIFLSIQPKGLLTLNETQQFLLKWQTQNGVNEQLWAAPAYFYYSHSGMQIPLARADITANITSISNPSRPLNVTYTIIDKGPVNASLISAAAKLPPGVTCTKVTTKGTWTCNNGSLKLEFKKVKPNAAQPTSVLFSIARPDNYLFPPMNVTTTLGNISFHTYSAAYIVPGGLNATKTFNPGNFFPGIRPQVNITLTNGGTASIYNVTVSSVLDGFAGLSTGASANSSKTFKEVAPKQTVSFAFSVSILSGESGNKTLTPVHVDFAFAGLRDALSIAQGHVAIYPVLTVSVTTSPLSPQEGSPFSAKILIKNPASTSVTNVTLTLPLPAGLRVENSTGLRVSKNVLIIQLQKMGPKSSYVQNFTLVASNGVDLDLSKSVLSFSYQGYALKGAVPQSTVSVSENTISRYILPAFIALFVMLLTLVLIRRRVLTSAPSSPRQIPQKQA
jgi:hypothetical protein